MKELMNFCPVHGYDKAIESYPGQMKGFLKDNNVDGIELRLIGRIPYTGNYEKHTIGVHLNYWPYWLDFWKNDKEELAKNHINKQALQEYLLGAKNRTEWLEVIRDNIKAAETYSPEYLVWHVSHCGLEEIYTNKFRYSSEEVIDATIEVFNSISDCISDNTIVLFENLWWPGLKLTDPKIVERLFRGINKNNIGLMLDTGHLINTNVEINNELEAINYIREVVKNLNEYKNYIYGMHLNCSLSGDYQKLKHTVKKYPSIGDIIQHIVQIDQHRPFKEASLRELINEINPKYIVHELFYDNFYEYSDYLKIQKENLRKI